LLGAAVMAPKQLPGQDLQLQLQVRKAISAHATQPATCGDMVRTQCPELLYA
jgi:hypothetical protein